MAADVSCNDEQGLFVIKTSGGYSCFGYEVCFAHVKQLSGLLGRPDLAPERVELGTLKQYGDYRALVAAASRVDLGTYYDPGTPPAVKAVLDEARVSRRRITLEYGDPETGAPSGDRTESGTVGRSMGPLKAPLLIANSRSTGGGVIWGAHVVRIREAAGKADLYVHPGHPAAARDAAPRMRS